MKKITHVSVGIPAYNEGQNIQQLLQSLIMQKEEGIKLKEIIVMSDGSSDDTEAKVKAIKDRRIKFLDDGKRMGKSARLAQIFSKFKGDALVLIDADVYIKDSDLLAKTIKHANLPKTGLAGINARPLPATTFFERIIEAGVTAMKTMARTWNNGHNYLSFKGAFLALDAKLAKTMTMPKEIVNNDAYIYFAAVQDGYSPAYLKDSFIYFRSPATLADHIKQSSRYQSSKNELKKYFTLDWETHYKIPVSVQLLSVLDTLLARPIDTIGYIAVFLYAKLVRQTNIKSTWSIATSTKGRISV